MAAPTFLTSSTPATDTGGAWTHVGASPGEAAVLILQIVQDGATAGAVTLDSMTADRRAALDGTANTMTSMGTFQIGGTSLAIMHLWIGRTTNGLACTYTGSNSSTEDIYIRDYSFRNVSAGTSLATVIENVTGGSTILSNGTSATVSDADVTTTGSDRLALNLIGINDDNPFAGFTGQSGGTWTTRVSYAEASGTDAAMYLVDAAMASAGTIDGGTGSITDSDAWGVVGFALIGTTIDVTDRLPPYPVFVNQAVPRASSW